MIRNQIDLGLYCFYLEITWKIHWISYYQRSGNPVTNTIALSLWPWLHLISIKSPEEPPPPFQVCLKFSLKIKSFTLSTLDIYTFKKKNREWIISMQTWKKFTLLHSWLQPIWIMSIKDNFLQKTCHKAWNIKGYPLYFLWLNISINFNYFFHRLISPCSTFYSDPSIRDSSGLWLQYNGNFLQFCEIAVFSPHFLSQCILI